MKIEKINDNQIRCTLTSDDLANREIKLSELAYGTDKAKNLFRDMMLKAQNELGFEADNIPLMIEAIPVTPDSIVLIITKVEDPEELDTRFSKFTPTSEISLDVSETPQVSGADDIIDIFQKLCEAKLKGRAAKKRDQGRDSSDFRTRSESGSPVQFSVTRRCNRSGTRLKWIFRGYEFPLQEPPAKTFALVLHQSDRTPEEFNKICNMLSEYGIGKAFSAAGEAYLLEHGETIIKNTALQQLVQL